MKIAIDVSTMQATASFDGVGLEPIVINAARVPEPKRKMAEMMGLVDKCRDKAALSRKQADGSVITITERMRYEEFQRARDNLYAETPWNAKAQPREDEFISLVTAAIAQTRGVDVATAAKFVATRSEVKGMKPKAFCEGIVQNAQVQAAYLALLAARVGPVAVDADEELAALS